MNGYTQRQENTIKGTGSILVGVLQAVSGGMLVLVGVLVSLTMPSTDRYTPGQFFCLLFILGGTVLLILGVRRSSMYSVGQRVLVLMQGRPREKLSVLSHSTGKDYTRLVRDLRELSSRRFFLGAYVDLNRQEFVLRPDGPQPPLEQGGTRLQEKHRLSAGPLYLFALTWLVCALLFPMYRGSDMIVTGILSVAVLIAGRRIFPKRIVITEVARKVEPPKPPEKIDTGNTELDEVLAAAMTYMAELTALEDAIISERMRESVRELVRICQQIFDYIKKTPEKVRQIRQFMNYYLPTTINLLQNYEELSRQPVKGDNIKQAMTKIEETILIIKKAFEKELDSLYADKAMDITVDIEVLQNMMEQEGLTHSSLDRIRTSS